MQLITAEQVGPENVSVTKPFCIQLDETPTSGYKWQFEPFDDAIFLLENNYILNEDSGIGGGGKRSFVIRIDKTGEYMLKLNLVQPWVGLQSAVKNHSFIIHVK